MAAKDLENMCLIEVERMLLLDGKSLKDYHDMPFVDLNSTSIVGNSLIMNELNYDDAEMSRLHNEHIHLFDPNQRVVYNEIIASVNENVGGFFFVYGHGGIGKTFLWQTLSYKLRSEKKIVLNVASSGIASLLLPGGRTAHSLFCIPLTLNEDSCCAIHQGSSKVELLQRTSHIIWDESPMINRLTFEAFDRTLKDIMSFSILDSLAKPFRGKVVMLGGDFRQILSIVPCGSRANIVMATINSSVLWKNCKVLKLETNMRLQCLAPNQSREELREFADWILAIGEGTAGVDNDGIGTVNISTDLVLNGDCDPVQEIVDYTYPNLLYKCWSPVFFTDKVVLATTLDVVETINSYALSLFHGEEKVYLSSDTTGKIDESVGFFALLLLRR